MALRQAQRGKFAPTDVSTPLRWQLLDAAHDVDQRRRVHYSIILSRLFGGNHNETSSRTLASRNLLNF
jgi:hypothetical protein